MSALKMTTDFSTDGKSLASLTRDERTERLVELIESKADGQTSATIKADFKGRVKNIDGVSLETKGGRNRDGDAVQLGRALFEGVKKMLAFGGVELRTAVELGYQLENLMATVQNRVNETSRELRNLSEQELNVDSTESTAQSFFQARASIKLRTKLEDLDDVYTEAMERISRVRDADAKKLQEDELQQTHKGDVARTEAESSHECAVAYVAAVEAHAVCVKQAKAIGKEKRRCTDELERETVTLKYVSGINQIKYNIANKIREAASRDNAVREVLRGKVVLPITKVTIFNSYEDCNLSGMYELLHQTYSKANFVSFSHDLMHAMTYQAPVDAMRGAPMQAVKDVDALISVWDSMEYWEYMTPDLFFTCTLLRGLQKASFSAEIVREASNFLQNQENGGGNSDTSTTSANPRMPLYEHVSRFIQIYEDSSRLHQDKGTDKKVTVERSKQFQHGLEQAAVAAVAAAVAVHQGAAGGRGAFGKPSQPFKPIALEGPPYKVTVGRQHHVLCRDTELPYTATKEVCEKCHGEVKGKFGAHKKMCYARDCHKCGLYGHGAKYCDQHESTYQQGKGTSRAVDYAARVEEIGSDEEESQDRA
jgi:hypothetical protein